MYGYWLKVGGLAAMYDHKWLPIFFQLYPSLAVVVVVDHC
jgi:hypothetical protein